MFSTEKPTYILILCIILSALFFYVDKHYNTHYLIYLFITFYIIISLGLSYLFSFMFFASTKFQTTLVGSPVFALYSLANLTFLTFLFTGMYVLKPYIKF